MLSNKTALTLYSGTPFIQILLSGHLSYLDHKTWSQKMWPGLRKSTMWAQKNRRILACLLYHDLITVYTTATKSSSLLQNFMGFLLQLTEMG